MLVGILIGIVISLVSLFFCLVGTLRIVQSDPLDNPYMFLEIKKRIDDISRRKVVILRVQREDFIPHK